MLATPFQGERLSACTDCRRYWAQYRAGNVTPERIGEIEGRLAITAGTCGVMGTASTMACLAETKQGPCILPNGDTGGDGFVVEVGEKIHGTCKFVIEDFFGKKIIRANIEVVNKAEVPMHCHYYVAFFDKDGQLLGCASQGTSGDDGLKPGRNTQFGSCLIPLPPGTHEKVASYKVAFYESKIPIGK